MTEIVTYRLWLGDSGRMVCETEGCAGPELLAKIESASAVSNILIANGEEFFEMNPNDLGELALLLKSQGKELTCDGEHVYYDVKSQSLQPKGNRS